MERLYEPDYEALIVDQQVLIRTLWRVLEDLLKVEELPDESRVYLKEILSSTKRNAIYIVVCTCGHLMADHDSKGCMYLGCKPICGNDE